MAQYFISPPFFLLYIFFSEVGDRDGGGGGCFI